MKLLHSAFAVLSLSARSSGFAPGPHLSSTRWNNLVKESKSSSMTSQISFIDKFHYSAFCPKHCATPSSSDSIDAMSSSLVTLVGENLRCVGGKRRGNSRWIHSVAASDGYVYGIASDDCFVIRFDPRYNSTMIIGDDLPSGIWKMWWGGVEANNGCIYALPFDEESILKIDTQRQVVVEKVNAKLPESNVYGRRWGQGALAEDGCVYYFPNFANRILKLDPSNDSVSCVGDNLRAPIHKWRALFSGTVHVDDGCLIGIPSNSKQIFKFDPKEPHTTTMVGVEAEEAFQCDGDGALGGDGNVYAINGYGKILQIDVAQNRHSFIAEAPESTWHGWCGAVTGMDGNIYFIPYNTPRVMKYDITTQQASLIGDDLGNGRWKYHGGALNPFDGKIYCLPYSADQVLSIDTNITTQNNNSRVIEEIQNENQGSNK